ncbi:MAG: nitrogen regulation protein NR(I) [Gammaproteobacteria bacterium]|nr:nitrogen regulation protein NR(I) [Gammaproteobacteria bacterium]MXY65124.1 nitrogen regulation protein NR(I) [Gammaproteobacteria bacterium]MYG68261.1 nitrogen regulation protein NR(I) [Gammaproteobacteria bacterium]MYH90848.1 nitrogen regulation protein NR(I) [Gammaproteobacteria bacterium]
MTDRGRGNVWVVDDDASIGWVLEKALTREGYAVERFESAQAMLAALERRPDSGPDVVLSDIRMEGMGGFELVDTLHDVAKGLPVIIMTAYGDLDSAVNAYRHGAFEYLTKPFDIREMLSLVERACHQGMTVGANGDDDSRDRVMMGESAAMQEVFRIIGRLSSSDMNVLVRGESGTGKELVANAIHRNSPRSDQPMIAINTAAIPSELLESELFGHEKGAFTGAHGRHIGRFEQADGGTLFLDEIGDMPAGLQTRLLRVLSEGRFYRVGGRDEIRVDVRVIAATNQDLEALVSTGAFRNDLFHRLNVIAIHTPPLRECRSDIPMLVTHFLRQTALELRLDVKQCSPEVLAVMQAYQWPGNVRELENMVRRLTVLAPSKVIQVADLPGEMLARETRDEGWVSALADTALDRLRGGEKRLAQSMGAQFETALIRAALTHSRGHKQKAAELLGWGRNTLTRKLRLRRLE